MNAEEEFAYVMDREIKIQLIEQHAPDASPERKAWLMARENPWDIPELVRILKVMVDGEENVS